MDRGGHRAYWISLLKPWAKCGTIFFPCAKKKCCFSKCVLLPWWWASAQKCICWLHRNSVSHDVIIWIFRSSFEARIQASLETRKHWSNLLSSNPSLFIAATQRCLMIPRSTNSSNDRFSAQFIKLRTFERNFALKVSLSKFCFSGWLIRDLIQFDITKPIILK